MTKCVSKLPVSTPKPPASNDSQSVIECNLMQGCKEQTLQGNIIVAQVLKS